mmetsp:Transcript_7657/g.24548  ORF Transcript_7657/g.24548 Transcript_7657/m.24548 type:complete len:201 (+) Transcript_7657:112-714(+)
MAHFGTNFARIPSMVTMKVTVLVRQPQGNAVHGVTATSDQRGTRLPTSRQKVAEPTTADSAVSRVTGTVRALRNGDEAATSVGVGGKGGCASRVSGRVGGSCGPGKVCPQRLSCCSPTASSSPRPARPRHTCSTRRRTSASVRSFASGVERASSSRSTMVQSSSGAAAGASCCCCCCCCVAASSMSSVSLELVRSDDDVL